LIKTIKFKNSQKSLAHTIVIIKLATQEIIIVHIFSVDRKLHAI